MSSESIGIKIADGTFYPVVEQDFRGRRRLVVTTVRDNQSNVQIDFYRSATSSVEERGYIGSLTIENLQPGPKGDPEIEVLVGIDDSGNLRAEALDKKTGERQELSVSRSSLGGEQTFAVPDAELEEKIDAELEKDELITGESYPIEQQDRRRTYMVRKRNPLLLVLFLLLCLVVVAGAAWYVYQYLTAQPAESTGDAGSVAAAQPAAPPGPAAGSPAAAAPPPAAVAPAAAASAAPAAAPPAASPPKPSPPAASAAADGVWYTIKWGDTLWDISAAYYRNPWFYPRIARHPRNNIKNPDRILAGFKLFIPRD